jgi:hypothetical protein
MHEIENQEQVKQSMCPEGLHDWEEHTIEFMKTGLPLVCRHGCSPIHIHLNSHQWFPLPLLTDKEGKHGNGDNNRVPSDQVPYYYQRWIFTITKPNKDGRIATKHKIGGSQDDLKAIFLLQCEEEEDDEVASMTWHGDEIFTSWQHFVQWVPCR